jgi:hypothetical protein
VLDQISAGQTSPAGCQRLPHAGHPLGAARLPGSDRIGPSDRAARRWADG